MSNKLLRQQLQDLGAKYSIPVYIPPREYVSIEHEVIPSFFIRRVCTDNAIMIAWRGHQLLQQQRDVISWEQVQDIRYNDHLDFDLYSS